MSSVVLITGGSGFIGSHVVDKLAEAGYVPRVLDVRPSPWQEDVETVIGDVRRLEDVRRAMRGCDAVCHLAAAADVGEVQAQPAWATELNSTGTLNVLEAARQAGVARVVYASTVWVYSDVQAERVDEETRLPAPAHLYTAGKLSGELYCRSYAELYGLRPTILRFGIPYGPRARPAAVIPSFVNRALRGEPLTIAGSGEQERSFVYVEDLAEGVVRAVASPAAAGRTYNLAGRETTTIRRLAEIVCDEVADVPILHAEGRPGDLRGAWVDSDRAERELGWRATTPLREGVRRYAAWARRQGGAPVATGPTAAGAPATTAAAAVATRPTRPRRLAGVLASGARDAADGGVLALVAVASAVVTAALGARDEGPSEDLGLLGLSLLLPLWSLAAADWAPELARLERAVTATFAAVAILVIGIVSSMTDSSGIPHRSLALVVGLSLALTAALRLLLRRSTAWSS